MDSRTVVDRPLAVVNAVNTATPATYWVSVDHLNRPVKMTTATKTSVWDAIWQPWGGIHAITGSASLDARFPGQWFQSESGLHYNWHRSYDSTLGRYTQPDPLGFVDGPSVYGYAKGSPQRRVDRDGRWAVPIARVILRIVLPKILQLLEPPEIVLYPEPSPDLSEPSGAGRYTVDASCNVQKQKDCDPNCPDKIEGTGSGNSIGNAFADAQQQANENLKALNVRGCYKRHCHAVRCYKNGIKIPCN